jgi:excisionase family DNA binding protein
MEKICIVKRRKEGYGGALETPARPRPGSVARLAGAISIKLTPEQTGAVRSDRQFRQLCGGEAHAVIFNLHLSDALPARLLTPKALSGMLGVSSHTVLKLARAGVLKSCKIGRLRRFSVEDVTEYLRRSVADEIGDAR